MYMRDIIEHLEAVNRELKFAEHVHGRLTELREIDESDTQTFDRVIDELLDQKYPLAKPRRSK